jgi:hypothetical protein
LKNPISLHNIHERVENKAALKDATRNDLVVFLSLQEEAER